MRALPASLTSPSTGNLKPNCEIYFGCSDVISENPNIIHVYAEDVSAYPDKVSAYPKLIFGYSERISGYTDKVFGYSETLSAYSETLSAYLKTLSVYPETLSVYPKTISAAGRWNLRATGTIAAHLFTACAAKKKACISPVFTYTSRVRCTQPSLYVPHVRLTKG